MRACRCVRVLGASVASHGDRAVRCSSCRYGTDVRSGNDDAHRTQVQLHPPPPPPKQQPQHHRIVDTSARPATIDAHATRHSAAATANADTMTTTTTRTGGAAAAAAATATTTTMGHTVGCCAVYEVPILTTRLLGRAAELKMLWQNVLRGCHVQLIVGVDGVGKSALAAEFCERARCCGAFSCIRWFDARHALSSQLRRFVAAMGGRSETRVLLVLDDVQTQQPHDMACVRRLVARPHAHVFVLVTTTSAGRLRDAAHARHASSDDKAKNDGNAGSDDDNAWRCVPVVTVPPLSTREADELAEETMRLPHDMITTTTVNTTTRTRTTAGDDKTDIVSGMKDAKQRVCARGECACPTLTASRTTASSDATRNAAPAATMLTTPWAVTRAAACVRHVPLLVILASALTRDLALEARHTSDAEHVDVDGDAAAATVAAAETAVVTSTTSVARTHEEALLPALDSQPMPLDEMAAGVHVAIAATLQRALQHLSHQSALRRLDAAALLRCVACVNVGSVSTALLRGLVVRHARPSVRGDDDNDDDADVLLRAFTTRACRLYLLQRTMPHSHEAAVYTMHPVVAAVLRQTVSTEELDTVAQCLLGMWPRRWRGEGQQVALQMTLHAQALHATCLSRSLVVQGSLVPLFDCAATFLAHYRGENLHVAAQLWYAVYAAHCRSAATATSEANTTTTTTTTSNPAPPCTMTRTSAVAADVPLPWPTAVTARVAFDLGRVLHRLRDARAAMVLRSAYTQACAVHGPRAVQTQLVLGCFALYMHASPEHLRTLRDAAAVLQEVCAIETVSSPLTSSLTSTDATHSAAELRMLRETYAVVLLRQREMLQELNMHVPPTLLRDLAKCRGALQCSTTTV